MNPKQTCSSCGHYFYKHTEAYGCDKYTKSAPDFEKIYCQCLRFTPIDETARLNAPIHKEEEGARF